MLVKQRSHDSQTKIRFEKNQRSKIFAGRKHSVEKQKAGKGMEKKNDV